MDTHFTNGNFLFRKSLKLVWRVIISGVIVISPALMHQGKALASAETGITYPQALDTMLSLNESLQSSRAEVEQREYEARAARGLSLPNISLSGRLTRLNDPINLDLNPIRDVILAMHPAVPSAMVPSFVENIQSDTFFKAQMNMVWPVYTGGKIKAAKNAADAGIREAEAKLDRSTGTLASELARYYFAARLAEQVYRIRTEVKEALELHLFQARRLQEEGFIARTEMLHAQVALAQADRELKSSRRDTDLSRIALANILASDNYVKPTTPLFLIQAVDPAESFVSQARNNHPALEQLQAVRQKAGENLRAAKSELYPQVYLFGTRELYENDLTVLEPSWAVGAGINFTIFDGRARANRILAARKLEDQVDLQRLKVARDLETLVLSRYQELMKAREQFDALQASLDLAEENLRARIRSFEEGLATSLDVVDAQLSLSSIKVERMRSAYDFDVALAQLLEACGRGTDYPEYLGAGVLEVEN